MTDEVVQENLDKRSVSRSASMVMLGGIFSLLAGFVNQLIIAAYFGAGTEMDAYLTAAVIPGYFQVVLLTGLSFVFIPIFVGEETKGNKEAAWELVGTFFWITAAILSVIAITGSIFAKQIISVTAPGFGPEKSMQSARMLSVLMFTVPFSGLGSYTVGIQQARGSFFWPAFAGAINSIGNILVVVLLTPSIGPMALPWGLFIAVLLQSCVTVFPVVRHGWPRLVPLTDSRIREMGRLILPFIVFGLLSRGTGIFERYFASALPSGQLSYLYYSGKITSIFQQLLAVGIASAIFPAMAKSYTQRGKEGLKEKTVYGLRLTLSIALPTVLIISALCVPLITFLFQRGEFHAGDTYSVAQVVTIDMLSSVLFVMLSNVIGRTFYVLKDTLTSPISSMFCVVLYLSIGKFFAGQWGYLGLAYAQLIQRAVFIFIVSIFLIHKLPTLSVQRTLGSALAYTLAAVGSFFIGRLLVTNLALLPALFNFSISALGSGAFYLAILYFWDREILVSIIEMFGVGRLMELARNAKSYFARSGLA